MKRSTVDAKARLGSRTPNLILQRFGKLIAALNPVFTGLPGQFEQATQQGFEIGIGGPGAYDEGITIGEVANIHQHGLGRVPQRKIIVRPPGSEIRGMAEDMKKELLR